jgi:hypothetical protein
VIYVFSRHLHVAVGFSRISPSFVLLLLGFSPLRMCFAEEWQQPLVYEPSRN